MIQGHHFLTLIVPQFCILMYKTIVPRPEAVLKPSSSMIGFSV